MKSRAAPWGFSLLPVFLAAGLAHGDQIFPSMTHKQSFTSCRINERGAGCTHFEGYIVVPKRLGATNAATEAARPDAVLSANRLYLPMEDDKTP